MSKRNWLCFLQMCKSGHKSFRIFFHNRKKNMQHILYQIIHQLTEAGIGILMLTSDMVELIGLSDRTLVFYEGKIVKELSRGEITEERVMKAASGMTEE